MENNIKSCRWCLFHMVLSFILWVFIVFSFVAVMSCAGMQREYTINYDKNGNITGGISFTPYTPVTCGSGK